MLLRLADALAVARRRRYVPTVYVRLSTADAKTAKGTLAEYESMWANQYTDHLGKLENLCRSTSAGQNFLGKKGGAFLPGELYLFAVLYQATLVRPSLLAQSPKLGRWCAAEEPRGT